MYVTDGSTCSATRAKAAESASGVIGALLIDNRLSSFLAPATPRAIAPIATPIDKQLNATDMITTRADRDRTSTAVRSPLMCSYVITTPHGYTGNAQDQWLRFKKLEGLYQDRGFRI